MKKITTDGYTNEQRVTLVNDFLALVNSTEHYLEDMPHALAYAARLRETGQLNEAEIYCFYLSRDEIMKPGEFSDFLWTLDQEETEGLAKDGREAMQKALAGETRMTKKRKAFKMRHLAGKISDAATEGKSQEELERLIRESMKLIDTPTVD